MFSKEEFRFLVLTGDLISSLSADNELVTSWSRVKSAAGKLEL